jgi:maleylpyruvate isomerase
MTEHGLTQSETADIRQAIKGSRSATARLLTALDVIDELDATRPSLLPDWTVGHVLTHLARNADSFVWILRSASEDKQVPQYPGGADGRSRDIADGALRPADAIVEDLRDSAARLDAAWDEVPQVVWRRQGLRTDGSPLPCRVLPVSRWREVEAHHVDLGLGYGIADWPEDFVSSDLPHALDRLPDMIEHASQRTALLAWIYGRAALPSGIELRPF